MKKNEIPKWVFTNETAVVAVVAIYELNVEELLKIEPTTNIPQNLSIRRKEFSQKWKLPPRKTEMKTPQGQQWAKCHREKWIKCNPILEDEKTFRQSRPSKIEYEAPGKRPEEILAWKEFFKYATEIAYTPSALKTLIKQKTGVELDKNQLKDWEKIRRWATNCARLELNPAATEILGWTKNHTGGDVREHPIIIRAAYCGISPSHLMLMLKQANHAQKVWRFEDVRHTLINTQRKWYFPPAPWMMTSKEGQDWAKAQLEQYQNLNPFPKNKEDLYKWDGDNIPSLVPIPAEAIRCDSDIINKWLKTQHD
jgi:hypothetical protein